MLIYHLFNFLQTLANIKMKTMAKMLSLANRKMKNNAKKLSMANRKMKNKGKKLTRRKQDKKKRSVLFLPDEILAEILSWLTTESLLRCKCVCKQWHAIIQDGQFVEMHMGRNKGIFHYSKRESTTLNPEGFEETFTYLYTCDGLLLERSIYDKYRIRNPSTKQILALPDPQMNSVFRIIYFHSSTGTYRVMSIHRGRYGSDDIGGCEVLDLGGCDLSWRSLNISQYHDLDQSKNKICFLLIDGMLHCFRLAWAGSSNAEIFSLDLEKEEVCTCATVPRNFFSDWWKVKFISWDGNPALVRLNREKLIVWILEDYKIQKWADCNIVISLPFLEKNLKMKGCRPWIAQDGLFYFHVNRVDSFVYHIESKSLTKLPEASSYNIVRYQATMVSLKGMQPEKKESKNEVQKVS